MTVIDAKAALFRRLGHSFKNAALAEQALTHRSHGSSHNERLEFLGDAIVNFVIAEALFARFPNTREGELTRMRATLIRTETLASIAREFELGEYLRLGSGEMKSGGKRRESILADTLEALIGAIFLDAGIDECKRCVHAWFETRLQQVTPGEINKDPKTRLQEWLQARGRALPVYTLAATHGEEHNQQFDMICTIPSVTKSFNGSGASRRVAEQEAAQHALDFLLEK